MSKKKWSKKVTLCVIAGEKKMNDLMASVDQNDSGHKLFATPEFYSVTLSNARTRRIIIDHLAQNVRVARIPCAAIFFTDCDDPCWVNTQYITVSNGNKWFGVKDFIQSHWNANGLGSKKNAK